MLDRPLLKSLAGSRNSKGLLVSACFSTSRLDDWRRTAPTFLNSEFNRVSRERGWTKDDRRLVEEDLSKILDVLQYEVAPRTQGLAVFADGGNGLFERVELPLRLKNRFIVEPYPYVRPLVHALSVLEPFLVARVSRDESNLYLVDWWRVAREDDVTGPYLKSTDRETGDVPVKEYYAAARQESLIDLHFKETAANVDALLEETGARRLVLSGQHDIVSNFSKFLSTAAQARVSAEIAWDAAASVNQLVVAARDALAEARVAEMERLIERVIDGLGPQGLGAKGFDDIMQALGRGQVQTLLVERGFRPAGWGCVTGDFVSLEAADACPHCGSSIMPIDDVFGEAVRTAILQGSEVEVVEGVEQLHDLGGIAALLRYR